MISDITHIMHGRYSSTQHKMFITCCNLSLNKNGGLFNSEALREGELINCAIAVKNKGCWSYITIIRIDEYLLYREIEKTQNKNDI